MTPTLLHHFFERSAARFPEGVAVEVPPSADGTRTRVTYAELDALACALAARLSPLARPDGLVAILLPRSSHHLYAAQLAVLKVGLAYTCLDPAFPLERMAEVLADARPVAVLCDETTESRMKSWTQAQGAEGPPLFLVDAQTLASDPARVAASTPAPRALAPNDLCYVVYTSGTTGKPKGVAIEHRSVVNLVSSDVAHFALTPEDRVGQSSSAAYDSSVEEIWLAFAAGATLVAMDDDVVRLGPDLVPWLQRERVSVLCPPPTLLRATGCGTPDEALPDLRLLYVGGEALPPDLADRWARGRRMENGYGPTECTVTVTRAPVRVGEPVTIGRAVPGNVAHVLGEALEDVADGAEGELCIGGAGLARGYLHDAALTARRFISHPKHGRLYRTGDLVRRAPTGDLEYLGRIDAQVKVRGYRIELGDVESHLAALPGVRAAACTVQDQQLVAFIVPRDNVLPRLGAGAPDTALAPDGPAALELDALRRRLAEQLPGYMVPARLALLDALPTSTSGKLDRKALPRLGPPPGAPSTKAQPRTPEEALLLPFVEEALGAALGLDDDFFERGGDSLAAARLVSALRNDPRTASLTVRDVYDARSVAGLAARMRPDEVAPRRAQGPRPKVGRPGLVTLVQTCFLSFELLAASLLVYAGAFLVFPWILGTLGLLPTLFVLPFVLFAAGLLWLPVGLGNALLWKKLLIGRYRPGVYPVWGGYYLRHWFVGHLVRGLPWGLVEGTVFKNTLLRFLGARVGRGASLPTGLLPTGAWELLDIGDDVSVGRSAELRLIDFVDQHMVIGAITLGDGATLETRAGMGPGSSLGRGAYLTALSMLPAGQHVPDGERWNGVPATHHGPAPEAPRSLGRAWHPVSHAFALMTARSVLGWLSAVPGIALTLWAIFHFQLDAEKVIAWLYAPQAGVFEVLVIAALVLAGTVLGVFSDALVLRLIGRATPGVVPRYGPAYLRVWLKARFVDAAGNWLSGTLFWPTWLRMAGMRVGPKCEVSTIIDVTPELVALSGDCFFADGIYLGPPRVHRGTVTLGEVSFQPGTFLGNHVVIHPGTHLPRDVLLGVCTVADDARMTEGTSWFGHPAFELPRREIVTVERSLTHEPQWYRYWNRVFWEASRFLLPLVPTLVVLAYFKSLLAWRPLTSTAGFFFGVVPLYGLGVAFFFVGLVWAAKWTLLGRVKPGQHALWSCWCSRWDFLYVMWGFYAARVLSALEGTQLLVPWLRAVGVRVGRRVFLGGGFAQVVDPDMLHFEDGATVACQFQAHSFEDRVLKIGHVHIREGASAGATAVLLYGADIGAGTRLGEHSVLMKHETLLPNRYYVGCPSRATEEPEPAALRAPE